MNFIFSVPVELAPANVSHEGVVAFTLNYSDKSSVSHGIVHTRWNGIQCYNVFEGFLEVESGFMKGEYRLVAEPYAPGLNYNRILWKPEVTMPFCLDSDGLLFSGMNYQLNLWSTGAENCSLRRSDGLRSDGWLAISAVAGHSSARLAAAKPSHPRPSPDI